MAESLLWDGIGRDFLSTFSSVGSLMWDGELSMLRHSGAFTGDVQLIRLGETVPPSGQHDYAKGYWLDTPAAIRWHPLQPSGLPEAIMIDRSIAPEIILADGRMYLARHTRASSSVPWDVDLYEFDPALCEWVQIGDTYTGTFFTKQLIGVLNQEPVLLDFNKFVAWDGSAWVFHSDFTSIGTVQNVIVNKFKTVGGFAAVIGSFRIASRWYSALIWNGFAWVGQHAGANFQSTAQDAFVHGASWTYAVFGNQSVAQFWTINAEGDRNINTIFGLLAGSSSLTKIHQATSFQGQLVVLGSFDSVTVRKFPFTSDPDDFTFSAKNIASISFDPPAGSELGGGVQVASPLGGGAAALLVWLGGLWVSRQKMISAGAAAVSTPDQLAIWDGASWTVPPAGPKGGFGTNTTNVDGKLIAVGNPF